MLCIVSKLFSYVRVCLCVCVYAFLSIDLNAEAAAIVYGQPRFTSTAANQGSKSRVSASTLDNPQGVAFHPTSGRLCVADTGNNRVLCYSAGNTTASSVYGQADFVSIVSRDGNRGGTASASTLYSPSSVAFHPTSGELCVADKMNDRVLCYGAGNTTASRVYGQADFVRRGFGGSPSASTLYRPSSVAFHPTSGELCIADGSSNRVLCYGAGNATGNTMASSVYGQADFSSGYANRRGNVSASTLDSPDGIAFHPTSGELCVADTGNNRVLCYSAGNTTASSVYGQADFVSGDGNRGGNVSASTLENPQGVAFHPTSGELCIADRVNSRVLCYGAGNSIASTVYGQADFVSASRNRGTSNADASTLNLPYDVAFDPNSGDCFFVDSGNNRGVFSDLAATTTTTTTSVVGASPPDGQASQVPMSGPRITVVAIAATGLFHW
ncbi:unnamed protein product [Polarella glacialis]|uniref:NHL repeat containing protein n=1 Tax=Polarella glacialis TaxID=89957 RepID=A0A813H1Y6_POLGL|nr:unnamed protein product [Polarella glacialis]